MEGLKEKEIRMMEYIYILEPNEWKRWQNDGDWEWHDDEKHERKWGFGGVKKRNNNLLKREYSS